MSDDQAPALNPRAKLELTRRGGDVVAVTVTAPVRGRPLRVAHVTREEEPALFEILARLGARAGGIDAEVDAATWDRLVDIGLLAAPRDVPPPVRFRCSPLDPPRDLVPLRARDVRVSPLRMLRVAPSFAIGQGSAPALSPDHVWVRVEHADIPLPSMLSFNPGERGFLLRLLPGCEPPEISFGLADALAIAGILVDPDVDARRRAAWLPVLAEARERLKRDRYAVVRGVVPPLQLAALRRYYRELVAEGYVALGDEQVPLRHHAHNEPLARMLHQSLAGFVGYVAGERVKPSYVYFASYLAGSVLAPHRDREQCEISVSLQVDFSPEPADTTPWPILVEGRPIALGLGDALVYRGRELTHARDALPEGHASASLFFHYVPEGFTGPLD
jgi:hypothetical protein